MKPSSIKDEVFLYTERNPNSAQVSNFVYGDEGQGGKKFYESHGNKSKL